MMAAWEEEGRWEVCVCGILAWRAFCDAWTEKSNWIGDDTTISGSDACSNENGGVGFSSFHSSLFRFSSLDVVLSSSCEVLFSSARGEVKEACTIEAECLRRGVVARVMGECTSLVVVVV